MSLGIFNHLRARLLYALFPADGNVWTTIQDPTSMVLYGLRIFPFYGVSVVVFLLTFFLIDRSDEFRMRCTRALHVASNPFAAASTRSQPRAP